MESGSTGDPAEPGVAGVDPVAASVLAQYGHRPTGPTRRLGVEVGELTDQPWSLHLEVSRTVGLDFSALEGRQGALLATPVAASEPDAEIFVLLVDGRPVGAWLSPGGSMSGVLPVSARP